ADIVGRVRECVQGGIEIALDDQPCGVRIKRQTDAVTDQHHHSVEFRGSLRAEHAEFHQTHADEHHAPDVPVAGSVEWLAVELTDHAGARSHHAEEVAAPFVSV